MVCLHRLLQLELHNLEAVCQLTDGRKQRFRRDVPSARREELAGLSGRLADPSAIADGLRWLCERVRSDSAPEEVKHHCLNALEKVLLNDVGEERYFVEIANVCCSADSPAVSRRKIQLIKLLISNPHMSNKLPSRILWDFFKLCSAQYFLTEDAEIVLKYLYHLVYSESNPEWGALRSKFLECAADCVAVASRNAKTSRLPPPAYPCRPVDPKLPWPPAAEQIDPTARSITDTDASPDESNHDILDSNESQPPPPPPAETPPPPTETSGCAEFLDAKRLKGREDDVVHLGYTLLHDSITVGARHFQTSLKNQVNQQLIPVIWSSIPYVQQNAYVFAIFLRFVMPLLTDVRCSLHYELFVNTFAVKQVLSEQNDAVLECCERKEMVFKMIHQFLSISGPDGLLSLFEHFDCNPGTPAVLRRLMQVCLDNMRPYASGKDDLLSSEHRVTSVTPSPVASAQTLEFGDQSARVWKVSASTRSGRYRGSFKRVCAIQKSSFEVLSKIIAHLSQLCHTRVLSPDESEAYQQWTAKQQRERIVKRVNESAPATFVAVLVECEVVKNAEDKAGIARYLLTTPGMNLELLGEILGSKGDWYRELLDEYLKQFNFNNVSVVNSLRYFFGTFRLPGEGQMIDRILDRFGKTYFLQQDVAPGQPVTPQSEDPNDPILTTAERTPRLVANELTSNQGGSPTARTVFKTSDVVFLLAFAVVMLNTDLHHPETKTKMSVDNFLNNSYRIEDLQTLSASYMRSIYQSVKENGLVLTEQQGRRDQLGTYPTEQDVIDLFTLKSFAIIRERHYQSVDGKLVEQVAELLWSGGRFWALFLELMSNLRDLTFFERGLATFSSLVRLWVDFGKPEHLMAMLTDMIHFIQPTFSYKTQAALPCVLEAFQLAAVPLSTPQYAVRFVPLIAELYDVVAMMALQPRLSQPLQGTPNSLVHQRLRQQGITKQQMRRILKMVSKDAHPASVADSEAIAGIGKRPVRILDVRLFESLEKSGRNAAGWFSDLAGMFFAPRNDAALMDDEGIAVGTSGAQNASLILSSDGPEGTRLTSDFDECTESAKFVWSTVLRDKQILRPTETDRTSEGSLAWNLHAWYEQALTTLLGEGNLISYILRHVTAPENAAAVALHLSALAFDMNLTWPSSDSPLNSIEHRFNMRRDLVPLLTWWPKMFHSQLYYRDPYLMDCLETLCGFAHKHPEMPEIQRSMSEVLDYVEKRIWTRLPVNEKLADSFMLAKLKPEYPQTEGAPTPPTEVDGDDHMELQAIPELEAFAAQFLQVAAQVLLQSDAKLSARLLRLLMAVTCASERLLTSGAILAAGELERLATLLPASDVTLVQLGYAEAGPVGALPLILLTYVQRLSVVCVDMMSKAHPKLFKGANAVAASILSSMCSNAFPAFVASHLSQVGEWDPPAKSPPVLNISQPELMMRYFTQAFLYTCWQILPLFCTQLADPPLMLFEPEEVSSSNKVINQELNFYEDQLLVPLVRTFYPQVAKLAAQRGVEDVKLMDMWRSIAQVLSVLSAFGTIRERRVAMLEFTSHLGNLPWKTLEAWYEIIEFIMVPELSLNYLEVYPCQIYPLPLQRRGPPQLAQPETVLGKSLIELLPHHYIPCTIPFSNHILEKLMIGAKKHLQSKLAARNSNVMLELKRTILTGLPRLCDPLTLTCGQLTGEDNDTPLLGIMPMLCRVLRVCLHEIRVQEQANVYPEAIVESLKALLVVIGSTPDAVLPDAEQCRIVLDSLKKLPEGRICSSRGKASRPPADAASLDKLDSRIRPMFECIQFVLNVARMPELFESIVDIIQ